MTTNNDINFHVNDSTKNLYSIGLGKYKLNIFLFEVSRKSRFLAIHTEVNYQDKAIITSHLFGKIAVDNKLKLAHFKRKQVKLKQNGQNNH